MNDERPAHDLRTDIQCLRNHTAEIVKILEAMEQRPEFDLLLLVPGVRHFGEQEQREDANYDQRDNDVRNHHDTEVIGLHGLVCFGLLFSLIGTILGGIWANDSWGRFWGWDPKENGALMIVLWMLIILHSRLGGYIRDHGLAMLAVIGGCIVAFSWWGVNLLGVGLHSYGFTTGVMRVLLLFYGFEALLLGAGLVLWFRTGRGSREDLVAEPPAPPPAAG